MSFEYPNHVRFTCERCGICCGDTKDRVRTILLLKFEAEQISQNTSKDIASFGEKIKGTEPYVYRMKKTDAGKCVFLKDNSCTIYKIRPLICRFYPFQLTNTVNGKSKFSYTKECPSIGKGLVLKKNFFEKLFNESAKMMEKDSKKQRL